ncbi:MAG: PucR family transcriptional regulator [Actinomycetales bacterium]
MADLVTDDEMGAQIAPADRAAATAVGDAVVARLDELAEGMTTVIRSRVAAYGPSGPVPRSELLRSCRAHARHVLSALGSKPTEPGLGGTTGRGSAVQGIPLPDVMSAYRLGLTMVWEQVAATAVEMELGPRAIVALSAVVWSMHDTFVQDLVADYRDEMSMRVRAAEEEASAVVAGLIDGTIAQHTALEAATLLRMPIEGPYVAVVAEVVDPGTHAVPGARDRLAAHDFPSAWRLLTADQVGIVRVGGRTDQLVEVLRRTATYRVGISPEYDGLQDTSNAVRLARLAMRSCSPETRVSRYDDDPLAVVSVAAPPVMSRLVHTIFSGLDEMPEADRNLLLETLRVWLHNAGSADRAAAVLFCHPNTVRHRLKRIEERTGRSLSDPRDLSTLCLAAEAELRQRGPT